MQRHAFPNGVADQSSVEPITDAHQRRFLFYRRKALQILKTISGGILDESGDFQMPKINVDARIDYILGHAIKRLVRRNRLNDSTFVLRAVVTEGGCAVKFAQHRCAPSRNDQAKSAQNQRAPADRGTKFSIFAFRSCPNEKMKSCNKRSLENEKTKRQANERDQPRGVDRQSTITGPQ